MGDDNIAQRINRSCEKSFTDLVDR